MQMVCGDIDVEIRRVFDNLKAIATAAGASLAQAAKVTVFLTDLAIFAKVNEIMAQYFPQPYPARAAIGVAQLPRGARVEIECILYLGPYRPGKPRTKTDHRAARRRRCARGTPAHVRRRAHAGPVVRAAGAL